MKKFFKYLLIIIVSIFLGSILTYFFLNREKDLSFVSDSLVYIESINENSISNGSGFVYNQDDNKNYIVTNYHVVEDSNFVYVYNKNKERLKANILGYDKYSDIAILVIEDKLNLKKIKFADSDKLNVGDEIYVVGTPVDINYFSTITSGIISYLDREIKINTTYGSSDFSAIQIDAPINPGNSGGPLLNKDGNVIGMIFVKESDINGVGFAIPINFVMDCVSKIEKNL